jgi:predicted transcriptional regulator
LHLIVLEGGLRNANVRTLPITWPLVHSAEYTGKVDLRLRPETEAKLNDLARRTRRGTDELLEEAVDQLVAYSEWFERKVGGSIAAAQGSQTVPDEEVRAWLEQRERR